MTAADTGTARPNLSVLLPEGWVRVATGPNREADVRHIAAQAVLGFEPQRRDMARVRVRNMLDDAVRQAQERGLYEVWLPIAPTAGFHLPMSFAVGPLPKQPADGANVQDTLLGLSSATPGALAVEISGVLGVRTIADRDAVSDAAGELVTPAVRLVSYIVSPTPDVGEWTVFTASLFRPDGPEADEIMDALEVLADSMMATVRIEAAGGIEPGATE